MFQVSGRRMMDVVAAAPIVIGRKRKSADDTSDPIVRHALPEKSAMATIMLNEKQAYQKTRRWQGQEQRQEITDVEGDPHQNPEQDESSGGH